MFVKRLRKFHVLNSFVNYEISEIFQYKKVRTLEGIV